MIIKKYVVADMREAMVRAKYELGKDAVIISERQIRDGKWFNPFKKSKLEVTVAIEEDVFQLPKKERKDLNYAINSYAKQNITIQEKKETKIYNDNGKIYNIIKNKKFKDFFETKYGYEKITIETLEEFIDTSYIDNCFSKKKEFSSINAFIGSTGVGKTTTIAKIASREYLINRNKVGLITMDTYRIGAVEQLKTYANILGIPCEVVNRPEDMQKKIDKLSYCDILLIDTVGTNHNNKEKLNDVVEFFNHTDHQINKYLVLSVSTDGEILQDLLEKYQQLKYDALVLTKLDELSSLNNFWNIIKYNKKPIQCFCFGQNVPEDMEVANVDQVLRYLWGELIQ